MDAVREALLTELEDNDDGVVGRHRCRRRGNVYGVTRGLWSRFETVSLDTPISESAIVGLAVGGAMAGTRPVVEIMYMDFIGVCLDQIMNQAAKLPFMTGGSAAHVAGDQNADRRGSVLGRAALAEPRGDARSHPGVGGGHAIDAGRLLRAATSLDRGPEPGRVRRASLSLRQEGPASAADHLVPIGVASVRREGRDLTIVSWSKCVEPLPATRPSRPAEEGIEAEVIDLRTVAPLDSTTLAASCPAPVGS